MGNPLSISDWTGSWTYTYDAANRLDLAVAPNPVPDQPAGGDYGYDWVGNRLNPPSGGNHLVYNSVDQLTLWPGMHSYTYDFQGNLTQVSNAANTSYTYTPAGLLNVASYGGRTLDNDWDADSNRVKVYSQ